MDRRSFIAATATAGAALAAGSARAADRDWSRANPIRYPDADVLVLDPRFEGYKLGNAGIERIYTGGEWLEGIAWNGSGKFLLWSDIPRDVQMRWLEEDGHVSTFRKSSNYSNGNTFDFQGRQIAFEHAGRRVVRYEHDGSLTVLADSFDGKPLNAPNDGAVHQDGSLWFTDPGYGSMMNYEGFKHPLELKEAVYRLDMRSGKLAKVTDELLKPNGICFSPDYTKLYVVDTGPAAPKPIYVWDVVDGKAMRNKRLFCTMSFNGKNGQSDGIRVDEHGNLCWPDLARSVREGVRVILSTRPGEQLMRTEFGGGLDRLLHEPNTIATRQRLHDLVKGSLTKWEPRILLDGVDVQEVADAPDQVRISIAYRLARTGAAGAVTVTVELEG